MATDTITLTTLFNEAKVATVLIIDVGDAIENLMIVKLDDANNGGGGFLRWSLQPEVKKGEAAGCRRHKGGGGGWE